MSVFNSTTIFKPLHYISSLVIIASIGFSSLSVFGQSTTPVSGPTLDSTTDSGIFSSDKITNVTKPKFAGVCISGDIVTLYDGTTALTPTYTCTSTSWAVTITSTLSSGSHSITYTRKSGTVTSAKSPATTITVDTTKPAIAVTSTLSKITNVNEIKYAISGTCTSTDGNLTLPRPNTSPVVTNLITCTSSGTFSSSVDFEFALDGNATFSLSQTDTAGNSYTYTSPSIVKNTLADAAPGVPSLAPGSDDGISTTDNITSVATPTFVGTCTTGDTIVLYHNSSANDATATCTAGAYSIKYVVGLAISPKNYYVTTAQINSNGNISSTSDTFVYYHEGTTTTTPTTAPEIALVSNFGGSNTDIYTSDSTPKIQGNCTTGDRVTLFDQTKNNIELSPDARCIGGRYDIILDKPLSAELHKIYQKNESLYNYGSFNKISVAGPTMDIKIQSSSYPYVGFSLSPTLNLTQTSESGSTDRLKIQLNKAPTGNVTISTASSNTGEISVTGGSTLTFTPTNWNFPQVVTLTGVNDTTKDGTKTVTITSSIVTTSTSSDFVSAANQTVSATNLDND
jgi:hypothetical protein